MGFLVLVASMAFQGFEEKGFAEVFPPTTTVSCGLHCVMKPVVQPVGKLASASSGSLIVAPGIQPVGTIGQSSGPLEKYRPGHCPASRMERFVVRRARRAIWPPGRLLIPSSYCSAVIRFSRAVSLFERLGFVRTSENWWLRVANCGSSSPIFSLWRSLNWECQRSVWQRPTRMSGKAAMLPFLKIIE